ncbi:MAG: DUF456 domain-containing protein [Bacteroidales bacterium]|nr:DUF456 domain-containing protein [Bacteroidales bacterium]
MDIFWIVLGSLLLIVGVLGCIIPIIPGPPISYISLLLLQITEKHPFTTRFLVIWALITTVVTVLDYVVPVYGTKKFGGSKKGIWGATIGLFIGIFFSPPIGIIVGPFLGALIGELIAGKESKVAFMSALGSFIGFVAGTLLKIVASVTMAYYFIVNIF